MIHFGPAGNCDRFYEEGNKASEQAPAWIAAQGLNAYEYSAGHGVSLGENSARKIGAAAAMSGVSVSIHAPYYINCGSDEEEKRLKSIAYLIQSAKAVHWMGGTRVIFHAGSPGKRCREDAFSDTMQVLIAARSALDEAGLEHIVLCPETMGRPSQLGTLQEVLALCQSDERMIPAIDFGHLHAAGRGALISQNDFEAVIKEMILALGYERCRHFHAHFSKIAYTAKGERQHMTFADEGFGPEFNHLAPLLIQYKLEPTIICESRGTQADDARCMKDIYDSYQMQGV